MRQFFLLLLPLLAGMPLRAAGSLSAVAAPADATPEARAVAYLAREVPKWRPDNHCYSCHHHGDAARALLAARRAGHPLPPGALTDTLAWVAAPERWDGNGGQGPFSDKALARLQFAATLADAAQAGAAEKAALRRAAALVAEHQAADGGWAVGPADTVAGPATHGPAVATLLACRTLRAADADRYRDACGRADQWFRRLPLRNTLDAAAAVQALAGAADEAAGKQRAAALAFLRRGRGNDGGWGPYANAGAETFDTAAVLIALATADPTPEIQEWRRKGRAFLVAGQQADGSWQETTRPPGGVSYAQQVATTGWALLALLATKP